MRKLGVLLAAGLLMFSVVSCSTKKTEDVSADSTTTTANEDAETSTTKKTNTNDDSNANDGSSALDDLETCGAVSALTATLGLGAAFLSDEQKADLQQELDDLRDKVPDEIRDDIETLENGASNADGIVELGEFLDSDEYREATENIGQYLESHCGAGNLGN